MRLGSSILGGKPMRIPGVVDVYAVGDNWVARSWPKQANQPNSAAQLLWRKKFKDAHALIKTFSGAYLRFWQAIECPPGKMWLDIAMTSIMRKPENFGEVVWPENVELRCYYPLWDHPGFWTAAAIAGEWPDGSPWYYHGGIMLRHGNCFKDVLKWNDIGWVCAKGKRPKKKWTLSYNAIPVYTADLITWFNEPPPAGWRFKDNYPSDSTSVDWRLIPPSATTQGGYCLFLPPISWKRINATTGIPI